MPPVVNLVGRQFGRWTVLRRAGTIKNHAAWLCKCSCPEGTMREVSGNTLLREKSLSCGCLRLETVRRHGKRSSRVYKIWQGMLQRCENPHHVSYHDYGGRGIRVDEAWHKFEAFYRDMGDPPSPLHTLDRRDTNGHYSANNCRWATVDTQQNNKRSSTRIDFNGKSLSVAQWSKVMDIPEETIRKRLKSGWTVTTALTTPSRSRSYLAGKVNARG